MHLLATSLALVATLGPWALELPVEGLTDKNGAAFSDLVTKYFATLKDDRGDPIALRVTAKPGIAEITVNCLATITLGDLEAALKGSPYSLASEKWHVTGRIGFAFASEKEIPKEKLDALKTNLTGIGTGTEIVEIVSVPAKAGAAYHVHIKFGKHSAPLKKLRMLIDGVGVKSHDVIWERSPHMAWYDTRAAATLAP